MPKRAYTWVWTARIEQETLPVLQQLAAALNFRVLRRGGKYGNSSPPAMLNALAEAYQRDPGAVVTALRDLGVVPGEPDSSPE